MLSTQLVTQIWWWILLHCPHKLLVVLLYLPLILGSQKQYSLDYNTLTFDVNRNSENTALSPVLLDVVVVFMFGIVDVIFSAFI